MKSKIDINEHQLLYINVWFFFKKKKIKKNMTEEQICFYFGLLDFMSFLPVFLGELDSITISLNNPIYVHI